MKEDINNLFDEYQKDLLDREKKLKHNITYEVKDDIFNLLNDIKEKEVLF